MLPRLRRERVQHAFDYLAFVFEDIEENQRHHRKPKQERNGLRYNAQGACRDSFARRDYQIAYVLSGVFHEAAEFRRNVYRESGADTLGCDTGSLYELWKVFDERLHLVNYGGDAGYDSEDGKDGGGDEDDRDEDDALKLGTVGHPGDAAFQPGYERVEDVHQRAADYEGQQRAPELVHQQHDDDCAKQQPYEAAHSEIRSHHAPPSGWGLWLSKELCCQCTTLLSCQQHSEGYLGCMTTLRLSP